VTSVRDLFCNTLAPEINAWRDVARGCIIKAMIGCQLHPVFGISASHGVTIIPDVRRQTVN